MTEFKFHPAKTYELLLKQANAMQLLIRALEKQKAFQNVSMAQMARELAVQGFEEINAQRNTNEKLTNEIAALEDERDALKAERDKLLNEIPEGCTAADARVLREENHKLVAQLEEARKQAPYAEWKIFNKGGSGQFGQLISNHPMHDGLKLYASPVPAQQAAVPTDEMVIRGAEELHDSLRQYGLHIDFDRNLNGTKIQQDIAERVYSAMLSAAPTPLITNPEWEAEAKRAFWSGLETGAVFGRCAILPKWNEYIDKRKTELELAPTPPSAEPDYKAHGEWLHKK